MNLNWTALVALLILVAAGVTLYITGYSDPGALCLGAAIGILVPAPAVKAPGP